MTDEFDPTKAVSSEVESLPVEPDEELPPAPGEKGDLQVAPLAEREAAKLAAMTPEQKARYDKATEEIMAHPAVAAFAAEEDRARAAKKANQEAFLAAYRKKQKEKS